MAVNTFTPSDGNVHPDFPDRRTLTGPFEIVDTLPPDPGSNSSLTRRSILNSVQEPVKHNLRGTIAGARSTIAVPYGLCRMPGKTTWWHFTNQKWYFVHCFGERVSTPTKLVVDGVDYSLTAQTSTGMWRAAFGGGFYSVYNGDQDYVDQLLLSLGVDYTDTHAGFCYGVFVQDQNFLSAWPRVELVGQGQDAVYDPRLDGGNGDTAYTTNPALILADIIDRYTPLMLDWPSVEVAADYCDETVNGEKRSEFGFAFQRARKVEDWIAVLREYAYCYVINDGATVRFICDCARASVKSFGNNEVRLATTRWKKGDLNTTPANVEVEYFNATTGESGQVTAVEDTGDEIDFYNMPGFGSKQQAQLWAIRRYNKMTLRDLTGSLTVEAEGIEIDFGDRITVTDQRYSAISSKDVEVLDIAYPAPGVYQWQVIEYQPNAYTDTPQSQPALADTTLPDPFDIDSVAVTVSATSTYNTETQTVVMDVSWDNPDFAYVDGYNVVVTDTDASPDRIDGTMTVSPRGKVTATFSGLQGGTNYSIKVTPFNLFSDGFESSTTHTTADDTVAPGAPTNIEVEKITLENSTGDFLIHFSPPSDKDIAEYQAEAEVSLTGAGSWSSEGGAEFGAPGSSPLIYRAIALFYNNTYDYRVRVRAVDRSGNNGAWSAWSSIFLGGS